MPKGDRALDVLLVFVKVWKKVFKRKPKPQNTATASRKQSTAASRPETGRRTAEPTPKTSISSPCNLQTKTDTTKSEERRSIPGPSRAPPSARPSPVDPTTMPVVGIAEKADDSPTSLSGVEPVEPETRSATPADSMISAQTSRAQMAITAKRMPAPNLIVTHAPMQPVNKIKPILRKQRQAHEPKPSHGTFYEVETPEPSTVDVSSPSGDIYGPESPPLLSATSGPLGDMPMMTPPSITPRSSAVSIRC